MFYENYFQNSMMGITDKTINLQFLKEQYDDLTFKVESMSVKYLDLMSAKEDKLIIID